MSEPETPSKKDTSNVTGAESPTTARPLDFDDEQETGIVHQDGSTAPNPPAKTPPPRSTSRGVRFEEDSEPPAKPPRPMDQKAQAEATLIEAFPSIDIKVVKAVLAASGGQVEPAFNALLGMSDPDYSEETAPPPPPPQKYQQRRQPQNLTQMQQDELYARQLAEHYNSPGTYDAQRSAAPQRRQSGRSPNRDDRDYSFFDDELPEIQRNIKQGFLQTQTKVNKWFSDFKKRMDGEDEEEPPALPGRPAGAGQQRQNFGPSQADQLRGIRKNAEANRVQRDRYDSDPRVLSDDFTELELRDDEATENPPKKPARPLANPDLFKPTPPPPQSGPVDEVEAVTSQGGSSASKSKKWQPLTTLAPAAEAEDNDPFSLGDSDDEAPNKSKDVSPEDTQRLKELASNKENSGENKTLEAKERSGSLGTRDKEAEELLKD